MDKSKKKELLNKYKDEQKQQFLNSLPMPIESFVRLFDYLDETDEDCAGDLRLTIKFLEEQNCPVQAVIEWLRKNGGGCDCEVLDNVEEKFVVMKIIPEREYESEDTDE